MDQNNHVTDINSQLQEIFESYKTIDKEKWTKRSIYKLPTSIKQTHKPSVYKPHTVSIGPYHLVDPSLMPMEEHKLRAFSCLIKRSNKQIQSYTNALMDPEVVQSLKDSYDELDENWQTNTQEFVMRMIVDGCFVLEVMRIQTNLMFLKYYNTDDDTDDDTYDDVDPIFSKHGLLNFVPFIMRDMLKLENQLPLLVLYKLFQVETDQPMENVYDKVNKLVGKFYFDEEVSRKMMSQRAYLHILDLFRQILVEYNAETVVLIQSDNINTPISEENEQQSTSSENEQQSEVEPDDIEQQREVEPDDIEQQSEDDPDDIEQQREDKPIVIGAAIVIDQQQSTVDPDDFNIPSAVQLHEAGIKFEKIETKRVTEITFNNGRLKLPMLIVDSTTETTYLNLIAFERLHVGATNKVTSYVYFMNNIIDNERDVMLLQKEGIIKNIMGSDKAAAKLFNRMSKDIMIDSKGDLFEVNKKVNAYCKRSLNQWRANFVHTYLSSPWLMISLIAALLLFGLTIAQTMYAVLDYYKG